MTEDDQENLNFLHEAYASLSLKETGEELYRRCLEKPIEKNTNEQKAYVEEIVICETCPRIFLYQLIGFCEESQFKKLHNYAIIKNKEYD